ncbi:MULTISPECIES: elongation factor P hydroxylase [unclassified Salinivibrio]|uniref:elongation factor P hydroxylase n=1 Tax=unclassified Salinivibrio TaxID=2636825 RepID=UPI000985C51A|nr:MULTISPECIES: elongation factor P hydroxylase [unclassified Salinivibrio]OOF15722.1 elongation factor P hydroxylase [Salinivibrio sp. PR919]OOF19527.1 elongation factor P hydroxylase [Salinivibrio sp. PR932]
MTHDYHDLIRLFNQTFLGTFNTELLLGGDEPIYRPADATYPHHRVIFARGFFASALHEIAHWTIAGEKRRQLEDYGYWYHPDGRDADKQAAFEAVEVKPQAIEWILSTSCRFRFQVSCDNLSGVEPDRHAFTAKVRQQVMDYLSEDSTSPVLPVRAKQFSDTLRGFYGIAPLTPNDFALPESG